MATALRDVAAAPTPSSRSWTATCGPTDCGSRRCAYPSGSIGVVYENRPNVTVTSRGCACK